MDAKKKKTIFMISVSVLALSVFIILLVMASRFSDSSKVNANFKQIAKNFLELQLTRKYREAYKKYRYSAYNYKEYLEISKGLFEDYSKFKIVKEEPEREVPDAPIRNITVILKNNSNTKKIMLRVMFIELKQQYEIDASEILE